MSAHHTSPLRPHGEDLLSAALSDPFSVPPDLPRVSPTSQPQSPPPPPVTPPSDAPPPSDPAAPTPVEPSLSSSSSGSISVSAAEQEAWKVKYDAQVVEWRRQSADVRAHAEAERARWEERRAREYEDLQALQSQRQGQEIPRADTGVSVSGESASASTSEWEAVSVGTTQQSASVLAPCTDTDRDASGDDSAAQRSCPPQNLPLSTSSNAPVTRPAPSTGPQARTGTSDSPPWEHVLSSPTSSFPSMSFPEPSPPHSPAPRATTTTTTAATPAARPATAASVTLSIFDHTLPARTRVLALFSSLSINMFLPFVNGVMLGFGEIFAKTFVVGWLGWGPTVATNVGLGTRSQNGSRRRWW